MKLTIIIGDKKKEKEVDFLGYFASENLFRYKEPGKITKELRPNEWDKLEIEK